MRRAPASTGAPSRGAGRGNGGRVGAFPRLARWALLALSILAGAPASAGADEPPVPPVPVPSPPSPPTSPAPAAAPWPATPPPEVPLPSLVRRLAFGSCAQQDEPQPLWLRIAASKPDVFVLCGDNVYGDSEDAAVLRAKYDRFAAVPEFRSFRAARPLLATWDDHDYGVNDGGADFAGKAGSKAAFLDFFGVPADSPRRAREGVYDAVTIGPEGKRVQVILLDTRWSRGPLVRETKPDGKRGRYVPVTDPTVPMLGAEQWAWLGERLREPAELRLVVSSIQVVAEDHGYETWANLPRERERLFAAIRDAKAAGVVFLSGDRHLAELSMMDGGVGYPLYDLTSSAINRSAKRWRPLEPNRHRVATQNVGDNFGLVAVDWDLPDPLVRLEIRDAAGDTRILEKLPLSTLRPRAGR